jgi:hypothetical protein
MNESAVAGVRSEKYNHPQDANEGCVGPESVTAGKASACAGCPNQKECASGTYRSNEASAFKAAEEVEIQNALQGIQHIVLVLS